MNYASEGLYNGYLRLNMAKIVSTVKVREIVPYLPCLTQTDREEIEAKREVSGNFTAMQWLLDCLKRRTNWPEEFIRALELCEHWDIASEIKAAYESLLGHRLPAAPAVIAHPVPASAPSPPEQPVRAPLTTPEVEVPLPQPDPQSVATSDERSLTSVSTEASDVATPSQNHTTPEGQGLPETSSQVPASSDTLSPSLPQASEVPTAGPAVIPPIHQMSPAKLPVQDSNPPAANASMQPVENSDPTVNRVASSDRQALPAPGGSAQQPGGVSSLTARADRTQSPAAPSLVGEAPADDELFSKPGTLNSCNAPVHRPSENAGFLRRVSEEQHPRSSDPYSGGSDRLQFSSSFRENPASGGGGTAASSLNEPEEDHYESTHRSLLSHQDVRVNVGRVSEDAPFLNLAGQGPRASNEQPSLQPLQNHSPPESETEPAVTGPSCPQRGQGAAFPYNLLESYYIPAAAVVGVSALVMLWRLKK